MLNKRKKRILITTAIMLCIVAVIVSVAAIYVHIKNKNIVPTKVSYKEIMESTTLPIGKYENLDLSNAVLNIPKADKLYNYYKLGQTYEIYTPDEAAQLCRDMFMKLYDYTESDGLISTAPHGQMNNLGIRISVTARFIFLTPTAFMITPAQD